jgi:hypothetical protein
MPTACFNGLFIKELFFSSKVSRDQELHLVFLDFRHRVLVGKPEGTRPLGDPDVDGRIILRWIFRKWEGVVWTRWRGLRIGTGVGHL